MTDSTDRDRERGVEAKRRSLSRRALLGSLFVLWSAGSLSDSQALRLYYGRYGYVRFGYGGKDPEHDEE